MIITHIYNAVRKIKTGGKEVIMPIPPKLELAQVGPVIQISIGHPKAVAEKLIAEGKPSPQIPVKALIDTGAGLSVITPEIAARLKLVQTGFRKITSVQDEQNRPVYYCTFIFPWGRIKELSIAACPIKGIDCLIGRDVLQHWHLTYNGKDGMITICD